jgi:tryptophan-rich sensory protein
VCSEMLMLAVFACGHTQMRAASPWLVPFMLWAAFRLRNVYT